MRVAVFGLLLANLLFFAWAQWIDVPAAAANRAEDIAALQLASGTKGTPSRCLSLGPMDATATSVAVAAALSRRGIRARARQVERSESNGYWIYIAGLSTDAAKQRALASLARAGVRDAAILPNDRATDRISAGLFSDRDGAQQRLARVRAAGFDGVIEERRRAVPEYWLDVNLQAGMAPPSAAELLPPSADAAAAQPAWSACPAAGAGG